MINTQEPANRESISSLQEEIHYLREENQAKTQIIEHLTDMKVVPSNNDITTGTCSCKLASTHTYCLDSNYKEPSIDLETNTKSNKNLDKIRNHQNKNITEKLDSDNINEKNKKQEYRSENNTKKEKKKDEENKRYEYIKKTRNIENDVPTEKQKTAYILGDSMVKKLNGYLLTKKVRHKFFVKVRPFTGAKVSGMVDHVKPTIRDDKPDHVILHTETYDLRSEKTARQIARSITEVAMPLKNNDNSVIVSGIIPRNDNLDNKATEVNNRLLLMCTERKIPFIAHSENIDSSKHLNESKFHLNHNGIKGSAETFSVF